jgi:hypothetical protein
MTSDLKTLNIKKTTTYDIVNPGPGFGEAQHGGRVKSVGYLTSCGNYFVHIEYKNKFNN